MPIEFKVAVEKKSEKVKFIDIGCQTIENMPDQIIAAKEPQKTIETVNESNETKELIITRKSLCSREKSDTKNMTKNV